MLRFVSVLVILLGVACVYSSDFDRYVDSNGIVNIVADHVISGSGAAGALAGYEISGDMQSSVLILESGPLETERNISLGYYNGILLSQLYDKFGHMGKSSLVRGFLNRAQDYPQTFNMIGGSTSGNNMNLVWLSAAAQQEQYTVTGSDVLRPSQYMMASKYLDRYISPGGPISSLRGTQGRITNVRVPLGGPLPTTAKLYSAFNAATNLTRLADYQLEPYGFTDTWNLFMNVSGFRSSAYTAFLGPDVLTQNNVSMDSISRSRRLRVLPNAEVTKIIIVPASRSRDDNHHDDDDNGGDHSHEPEAVGFYFIQNGVPFIARGRISTIDCTGTKQAHLMQVSGIGRPSVLQAAGIPVLVNNSQLGFNLRNHVAATYVLSVPANNTVSDFTNLNFTCTCGAFIPDPRSSVRNGKRGVQIIFQDGKVNGVVPNPASMSITAFLLDPASRGSITPRTPSLSHNPVVDYNYNDPATTDPTFWQLLNSGTMLPFIRNLEANYGYGFVSPGYAIATDPVQFATWLAGTAARQTHHMVGTMRAGPRDVGVVNPDTGNVWGCRKLYAYGTSTLPVQPDGNNAWTVFVNTYLQVHEAMRRGWRS